MSGRSNKGNKLAPFIALAIVILLLRGGVLKDIGSHSLKVSGGSGHTNLSGTLDCSQLEQLWESAGGSPSEAFLAAEVAMAESTGRQYTPSNAALNSNGMTDVGYWQINSGFYPSLATTDPYGNARAAVIVSKDGTNWTPWVTYDKGAEVGQC